MNPMHKERNPWRQRWTYLFALILIISLTFATVFSGEHAASAQELDQASTQTEADGPTSTPTGEAESPPDPSSTPTPADVPTAMATETTVPPPEESPTPTEMTIDAPSPEGGIVNNGEFFRAPVPPSEKPLHRLISLLVGRDLLETRPESLGNLEKIDSHLQALVADSYENLDINARANAYGLSMPQPNQVLVDIYLSNSIETARAQLEALGMQVMAENADFSVLEGRLPIEVLPDAAQLPFTTAIIPVYGYGVDTGSVTSQGDAAHNGPDARALGVDGTGVVVGVISDSIDRVGGGVSDSQATGDLPATVTVLNDSSSGSDEGRAMAEMIYDMAPGITTFIFSTGSGGATTKATSINNLVSNGVDIIVDDIFYLSEPFFQDGQVAAAANSAVSSGVSYFASAGNRGTLSYESDFRLSVNNWHDFNSGAGLDQLQRIASIGDGDWISVTLQWDDPTGGVGNPMSDYDLYLYSDDGNYTLLDSSTNSNSALRNPYEYVSWTNNTGSALNVGVAILRNSGDGGSFMKYILNGGPRPSTIVEWDTDSDAINPGAASAANTVAVAAVHWNDFGHNDPEPYSSRGPIERYFPGYVERQKPQVAGADCVSTTVPGFGTFCGTSAAAPSIGGIAALVLDADPSLTPAEVRTILTNPDNTIDCSAAGNPDRECGFGFVLADLAVAQANGCYPLYREASGSGDIPSAWPIHSSGCPDYYYTSGEVVTMSANPWSGNHLSYWGGTDTPTSPIVTMASHWRRITAFYAPFSYPDLLINEIDPGATDRVEFYNASGSPIDVDGWEFHNWDNAGNLVMQYEFPPLTIQPGTFQVLIEGSGVGGGGILYTGSYGSIWWTPSQGGAGALIRPDGYAEDFVRTGPLVTVPPPAGTGWEGSNPGAISDGQSWGRDAAFSDSDQGADWTGQCQSLGGPNACGQSVADFDGDGDTDVSLYRPSNGHWYVQNQSETAFGLSGDIPVAADYDGDGETEVAVYRPSQGRWYVQGVFSPYWGLSGDVPVPCDYDGDGDDDLAVYRPSQGRWYVRGVFNRYWGIPGDIPVPADYDGDGTCDLAVYRPSQGRWYVRDQFASFWGLSSDIPVPGDYDGDGAAELAVYRPSQGRWYVQGVFNRYWGVTGDIPVPGDYDGDGGMDLAVYRPSDGRWFVRGQFDTYFGLSGDFPAMVRDTNADGDPYH